MPHLRPALVLICLLAPLAAHALNGSYARFIADDFCSAAVAGAEGLLGGTLHWYRSWNGRFAANFIDSLAGLVGQAAVRAGPGLALAAWVPLLGLALAPLAPGRLAAATLAAAGVAGALATSPSVAQSLYWGQGMRSVVPPLILLTACAALLRLAAAPARSRAARGWILAAGGLLVLLAAGFNETYTAVQVAVLGAALAAALLWGPAGRALAPGLLVGLAASLAGLAIMVLAPGNAVRQLYFPPPPAPPELLALAWGSAGRAAQAHLLGDAPALLALAGLLGLGLWSGARLGPPAGPGRRWLAAALLFPAAALLLLYLCFVPAAYGLSNAPPDRTLIIPAYLLACAAILQGHLVGRLLPPVAARAPLGRGLTMAGAAAVAALALWAGADLLGQTPRYRDYAAAWDRADAQIRAARAAGAPAVAVPIAANPAGLEDVGRDPAHWVNICTSDYYGIAVSAGP